MGASEGEDLALRLLSILRVRRPWVRERSARVRMSTIRMGFGDIFIFDIYRLLIKVIRIQEKERRDRLREVCRAP